MSRFSHPGPVSRAPATWVSREVLNEFGTTGTNAHRLASSAEAWVERFGEDVLVSYKTPQAREALLAILPEWLAGHQLSCRRIFGKHLPLRNEERTAPVLLSGDPTLPLQTTAEENETRFGIDFAAGYSAGLFIDQRANRSFLRRSGVRRVLNTFAYTCSFSVVAALAGAETVSVDLSKTSLARGRENFSLNGLDTAQHRFLAEDVLDLLPRLGRRSETFDAIVLDPPTFSRGNKGRRFQVERDFEALLLAALEVAAPRARILLSTNCTRLPLRTLESIARFALKAKRQAADLHREPPLPDVPAEFAPATLWLLLK